MTRRWAIAACCGLVLLYGLAVCCHAENAKAERPISPPAYRIEADSFGAGEADIRAVLDSACRELWRFFPDCKLEPIVVTRGHSGPITLFQRNDRGEIVVRLDTGNTFWSQYSYQFAHEFCHILCSFKEGNERNKWFEETLAETASMFVMRAMARTWRNSPPYPNWRDYHDSLRDYVDDMIRKRDAVYEIYAKGLPGFYRAHQSEMEKEPCLRELNGAMAIVFLHLFEERPERWEAVRWLNATPAGKADTFATYLQKWHDAAPARCQAFVKKVADLYGVAIQSNAPAETVAAPQGAGQGDRSVPRFRVEADGFKASEADIRALLGSAARELWRFFPESKIEPFVVVRGHGGPTVLYARMCGEIVVQLDTEGTLWSQYAYQFSCLFGNILCGFDEKSVGNRWFEVSVCEAASLFALKGMSRSWEKEPPYPNWKDYRHALAKYAEEAIGRRERVEPEGLRDFYQKHRDELARSDSTRPLGEAMAAALLKVFEERPEHWEAVRWLNKAPSPKGEPFGEYLQRWHDALPKKHKPFARRIAELYGLTLKPAQGE